MMPLFKEAYTDLYENIVIEEEGNKFFLTIDGQKLLDNNNQPFTSKSENGARGKIKEIIDSLNQGCVINLAPIDEELNNNYCKIIKFPDNQKPSSGLARKLFFIQHDPFYNIHYPDKTEKPAKSSIIKIIIYQSGFILCPVCKFPDPFFIDFEQSPIECIHCGALITAKKA